MTAAAVYAVVLGFVFVESGLLVGFLLPGDTHPVRRRPGVRPARVGGVARRCWPPAAFAAAVAGDSVGYALGLPARPRLARAAGRPSGRLDERHLHRADAFFARWGWWAVVVARWIPWVRTFTPIVAGTSRMPYLRFLSANVVGALCWAVGLTVLGSPRGRHSRPSGTSRTPWPRCSWSARWLRVSSVGCASGPHAGSSVAGVGRHTVPGTGTPEPDRGFWVRIAVAAVVVLLVGGYFLTRGGGDDQVGTATGPTSTPSATSSGSSSGSSSSPAPATTIVSPPHRHRPRPPDRRRWPSRCATRRTSRCGCRAARTLVSKLFKSGAKASYDQKVLTVVNGRPAGGAVRRQRQAAQAGAVGADRDVHGPADG